MTERPKPTLLDLDAIEARAKQATPGPWSWNEGEEGFEVGPSDWRVYQAPPWSADRPHPGFVPNGLPDDLARIAQLQADEEFIAHAREDVPALIAALREARTEIARLQKAIQDMFCDGLQARRTITPEQEALSNRCDWNTLVTFMRRCVQEGCEVERAASLAGIEISDTPLPSEENP